MAEQITTTQSYRDAVRNGLLSLGLSDHEVAQYLPKFERKLMFLTRHKANEPYSCLTPDFFDFAKKVKKAAELLDVDYVIYKGCVLKSIMLCIANPQTINKKAETAAKLLGVSKQAFVEAALTQPQLFELDPFNMISNIEGTANLLGVSKNTYVTRALLRQPSLAGQPTSTARRNLRMLCAAQRAGFIVSDNLFEDILRIPAALSCSRKNTALRVMHALLANKQYRIGFFFSGHGRSKKCLEEEVTNHLLKDRTGRGEHIIRTLHKNGIISGIPDCIETNPAPVAL